MPLAYRPADLQDLIAPPKSAAEQVAGLDFSKPIDHAAIHADCARVLRLASPDASDVTVEDAANVLENFRLSAAVQHHRLALPTMRVLDAYYAYVALIAAEVQARAAA